VGLLGGPLTRRHAYDEADGATSRSSAGKVKSTPHRQGGPRR